MKVSMQCLLSIGAQSILVLLPAAHLPNWHSGPQGSMCNINDNTRLTPVIILDATIKILILKLLY